MPKDYALSFKFAKKACEGRDSTGCYILAELYEKGQGVVKSEKKAGELFKDICENSHLLGSLYGNVNNQDKACFGASVIYLENGAAQNLKKYIDFSLKACELKYAKACENLALSYLNGSGVRQDYRNALKYAGIACDLGEQKSCEIYKAFKQNPLDFGLSEEDFKE